MWAKINWVVFCSIFMLFACQNNDRENMIDTSSEESISETQANPETKTIQFISGVFDDITRGDKYNYYAIEGEANGFDRVTAIIEGTAVDIRTTDNTWHFNYPYSGPNVETEITFTTDPSVVYGETGIDLAKLPPESYVTITFIPNENPVVEEASVVADEGQSHTFRNSDSTIVEIVTVTGIEVVEADPAINPLGNQLLKVDIQYVNDGSNTTHIAPNYFTAQDGEGHFLPLRYSHFWLVEVLPGDHFTETIYFDITDEGPYTIRFFDGEWQHLENRNGTEI